MKKLLVLLLGLLSTVLVVAFLAFTFMIAYGDSGWLGVVISMVTFPFAVFLYWPVVVFLRVGFAWYHGLCIVTILSSFLACWVRDRLG